MTKNELRPDADAAKGPDWTEETRLAALYRYQILDTPEEDDFNELVRLAAEFCHAPVSIITLIDKDRQWFKAKIGTDITNMDVSFCKHTLLQDDVMVVNDATKDKRFSNNELVTGDPNIRFYAGANLKTAEGLPIGTICILDFKPREITKREAETLEILARQVMVLLELKRTLREKEKSEERLQFALDTSSIVGTWDYDLRKHLVYGDARFCGLFSIDPVEGEAGIEPERFVASIHADDQPALDEKVQIAMETAGEFSAEYRVIRPDGEIRWIFTKGRVYHDRQGQPLRLPGAVVDITDRKRYERKQAARVELNDRLRAVRRLEDVTLIAAEIIGRTLEGVRAGYGELLENGTKIRVDRDWTSERARSVVGTHIFGDYGEEFSQAIRNGDVVVSDDVFNDPRFAGGRDKLEAIGVRSLINISLIKDGLPNAMFFIHDENPRHWREGEIELVTEMALRTWAEVERVHAEENTRAALEKAEAASSAKTEFLANMSHEIRTPMNAIIGLSYILAGEKLTPRQSEFVNTLQMSAESLLDLINDLLDISKIEARTVELEEIPFDLLSVIEDVISMMNVKASEKNLVFSVDAECLKNRTYLGDPTRIRQIILNLCSNAIKFTEIGGVCIEVACEKTHDSLQEIAVISVKDTGIGIETSQIASIFEKFIQADTSINRRYGGTGLGLAITKSLVTLMGGDINVESLPGSGSTFIVRLPLKLSAPPVDIPECNPEMSPDILRPELKKKVLLVEDYAPNVLVAGTFIEEFGYDWDSAKTGGEAVEKVKAGGFSAVLMDVQMFGMNGLEATQKIREHEASHKLKRIPIIGMTAHALAGDRERCLKAGMDDYISKPFDPDELQEKLALMTDQKN